MVRYVMKSSLSRGRGAAISLIALASAAALALTGCSNSSGPGADAEEGPLTKYLSALWEGQDWSQDFYDEQMKLQEEITAECMADEGFEYLPNVQSGAILVSDEENEIQWGSVEFAEQYGYGIIDFPGMTESVDPGQDYVDPNQEYIEALSPSEQEAFYAALYGPQPSEEELEAMMDPDYEYEYDWTTAGCSGKAQNEVFNSGDGAMAAYEDPEFEELFTDMNEIWSVIWDPTNLHEDVVQLNQEWASCMADAGFSEFDSPTTASDTLWNEWSDIQMPDSDSGEYVEPSEADKKQMQEREIEVAVADSTCKQQFDYDDKIMKLQFELEQEFVDSHKAELDALLAKHSTEKK